MDWSTIVSEILWMEEITEKELSRSLQTSITQPALNRLKKGITRKPSYQLGDELLRRHKKLMKQTREVIAKEAHYA
ncbi:MAG: hypothetical protein U1E78_11970 [Gammaproteobacteria bacterium]